jgi:adenylate cyclase
MHLLCLGIPGFDTWQMTLDAETLFKDLCRQMALVSSILVRCGGDIDKVLGDRILAVFPADHERSLEMTLEAVSLIHEAELDGRLPFPVAMGLDTGWVIAGFLGAGAYRDFTVIGDPVNTAARVAGIAETLPLQRVLLTETVQMAITSRQDFRPFGEVELKGKREPVRLFQLRPRLIGRVQRR